MGKKKAFMFQLDFRTDFFQTIQRHEDKIFAQLYYFDYYNRISPSLITQAEV